MELKFERFFFPTLDSTQTYLKKWAERTPLPSGTLVWTSDQRGGYGRKGTPWYASPGESLTFSFLLSSPRSPQTLPIRVVVALYETVKSYSRFPLFIKWPNDIWCEQGKIGGILVESKQQGNRVSHAFIGVGVNVYQREFPSHLTAASLAQIGEPPCPLEKLLADFEAQFSHWYFAPEEEVKERFLCNLWRTGYFLIEGKQLEGTILDWSSGGYITLQTDGGVCVVPAATLRMICPFPFLR
ncbi:MAG: biotin--[acetyl-CoA-carboxylase] ligase [Bacteroidia bacterium]|nr:biotin--[acetyl-CoA-carboxylase] ligase [Bacteroidia bacterium]MDW8134740.1 biotin--[acetyl-CoA-carboxylase] ligase [Bacteroidia bacterium]